MLEPLTPEQRPVLERLWQLYRHDLGEFRGMLPDGGGLFSAGGLPAFLESHPDRIAYLVRHDGRPAGFALVRGLDAPPPTVSEFFLVRALRRQGVGYAVATEVLLRTPGPWVVAFQEENPGAARFWRRVATDLAGDTWSEQRVPVPDKPWLPPDVWLTLEVPPG
ncbi:MAG: GNAT family N-acetyltransferase, partial [Sporichthyaceae bacterium]